MTTLLFQAFEGILEKKFIVNIRQKSTKNMWILPIFTKEAMYSTIYLSDIHI